MPSDSRPVVVAYDGSEPARAAVETAAELMAGRQVLVVSVWEPGLIMALAPERDALGMTYGLPSAEEVLTVDRAQRDAARAAAEEGCQLAREHGAVAMPLAIPDEVDPAMTIASVADEHDACAIVVGSRGLGRVTSRLVGSTSRALLHRATRPVLVVRAPH